MTNKNNASRRQLLRNAILGGLGYGAMAGLSKFGLGEGLNLWYEKLRAQNPWMEGMDALTVLRDALSGGPSMLFVSEAMAQGAPNVAFLDIFMSTSADVRNYLNLSALGNANNPLQTLNFGTMNNWVTSNLVQTDERFAASKVNKFLTELVLTGRYRMSQTGAPTTLPGFDALVSPASSPIDPSKIAFVSFVSYQGTGVHRQGATVEGSIAHLIQMNARLSPIGVAAFGSVSVVGSGGNTISAGRSSRNFVDTLDSLITQSYVDKDNSGRDNRSNPFDALSGNAQAIELRNRWIENLASIRREVASLKSGYSNLGSGMFNAFGNINVDRAASIAVAAKLAASGLGTVSSVGLNSFDFHQPDANRAPRGSTGNMITCTIEAGIGLNVWAKSLIEKKMDGVAFIRTCSGRNDNWVNDSQTVSSVAVFVKGSGGGPIGSIANAYYGPESATRFVEDRSMAWAEGTLGLSSGVKNANIIDGTVARTVINAVGKEMTVSPSQTLGIIRRS
jgi:hypothetical protein